MTVHPSVLSATADAFELTGAIVGAKTKNRVFTLDQQDALWDSEWRMFERIRKVRDYCGVTTEQFTGRAMIDAVNNEIELRKQRRAARFERKRKDRAAAVERIALDVN